VNIHKIYAPILKMFRTGRMKRFVERFAITEQTTVLDLGGGAFNWTLLPVRPKVTILDVYDHGNKAEWATYVVGDGCHTGFLDAAFDVVFSNSVIEHVGGIERQRQFAAECMRCGRGYFVQTPNKWFPVDTHTLMPFAHWLPQRAFRKLIRFSPRFIFFKTDPGDLADFSNMRLLSARDLKALFPGAEIIKERFCGITKSLIAVSAVPSPGQQSAGAPAQTASDNAPSDKGKNPRPR
jgi:2-polyprenyl-3-methyl-5-hydroxy-6-metoxy-1,4-benzoquinol methylase